MNLFTENHLEALRFNFAKIEKIDPSSKSYRALVAQLDRMPQAVLAQVAGAKIKFMSRLAANRVR